MSSFKEIVILEPVTKRLTTNRAEISASVLGKIASELLRDGAPYAEHTAVNEVQSEHGTAETDQET
jgi:hypothetical protein